MEIGDKIMFVPYCNRAGVTGEIKSKPVPCRAGWCGFIRSCASRWWSGARKIIHTGRASGSPGQKEGC